VAGWAPERRDHRRPAESLIRLGLANDGTGTTRAFGVLGIESQENANAYRSLRRSLLQSTGMGTRC